MLEENIWLSTAQYLESMVNRWVDLSIDLHLFRFWKLFLTCT